MPRLSKVLRVAALLGVAGVSLAASTRSAGSTTVGTIDLRVARFESSSARETPVAELHAPQRVLSVSLLSDELLEGVLPVERWIGVSYVVDYADSTPVSRRFPKSIPRTSGTTEDILFRQPDLVVLSPYNNAMTHAQLRNLGVRTYVVETSNDFPGLFAQWSKLGRMVGAEPATERKLREAREALRDIERLAARLSHRPSALLLQGMFSYGPSTLQGAALRHAGFENALISARGSLSPQLNVEQILSLDPEVLFVAATIDAARPARASDLPHPELLGSLTAVRQGRAFAIPGSWMASISHHALLASRAYIECALSEGARSRP